MQRHLPAAVTAALLLASASSAPAQTQRPQLTREAMATVRSLTVQVSPTSVLLTPATKTFTIELTNPGDSTIGADVSLQFASPRTDARARIVDSVLPATSARSLTTWLSGVPGRVTLAPKQKQTITVKVAIPPAAADGEYWGRIMIARQGVAMRLPATVNGTPTTINANLNLQSPVAVFYRKGAMSSGLEIMQLTATPTGSAVRACMLMHRTGPAHYDGVVRVMVRDEATRRENPVVTAPLTVYDDLRPCIALNGLAPGKYTLFVNTEGGRQDVPASLRVPVSPAHASVSFEVTAPKP